MQVQRSDVFASCRSFSATDDTDSSIAHFVCCDRQLNGVPCPYLRVRQRLRCPCIVAPAYFMVLIMACVHQRQSGSEVAPTLSLASCRRRRLSLLQSTLERCASYAYYCHRQHHCGTIPVLQLTRLQCQLLLRVVATWDNLHAVGFVR